MSSVLAYRALKYVLALLTIRWSIGLAKAFFKMGYWTEVEKRKIIIENLSVVYGIVDVRSRAKEVFASFGRYLVEFLSPLWKREILKESTEIIGLENALSVYRKGKGIIGLTAHIGNWEMGAYMTAQLGMEVSAVFITHPNPGLDRLFMNQRKVPGLTVIPWKQDATRRCLEALRKGAFLAIAGDIDFPGTGLDVKLFERYTKIPRGPIVFSKRTGAPIVPAAYVWTSSGSRLIFWEPIEPEDCSEEELGDKIARSLEEMIRDYPTQWICFEKMWKDN
jgi:KDO2-lipid IV(A) lauroyltransferase